MMILHHLPQTVKNNASKAEAPLRGIHSIVSLLRHHYSVSGSWVSTLLIAGIAGMLTTAVVLFCRTRQQRGGQSLDSATALAGLSWQASQFVPRQERSYVGVSQRPAASGLSLTGPALPLPSRRDQVFV